tara:strand:+ start:1008 stop:2294 length:1287 start_codon:yes stop_codon:yes gene_type:complete
MANKPGINNLFNIFEGMNAFGAGPGARTRSLLDNELITQDVIDKADRQSIGTGIVTGLASYLAQPKNKGYGSAVPYLAQSYLQANKAAQAPFQGVADQYLMGEKLKDTKRNQTLRDELLKDPSIANDPIARAAVMQNPVEVYKQRFGTAKELPYNVQELNSEIASLSSLPEYNNVDKVVIRNQAFKNIQERKKGQNQTIFNQPAIETSYDKTVGTGRGTKDLNLIEQAERVPVNLQKMDETVQLIRNPKTNVGSFADFQTRIDAAKLKFLNVGGKISESVSNTQLLDSMLGSDVFPMIKALGIGARGLDTPAERKFLQQVMTGEIGMTRDTLTKMTMIRRRQFAKIAKDYNIGLSSGRFDRVQKIAKLSSIDLKEGANTPLISQGKNDTTGKVFNIYADGTSYYLDDEGNVSNNKVEGFKWLDYNYDF